MMKKTFNVVFALVLVLTMLIPQTIMATAATEPLISASVVDATPGSTVEVTIDIANNPGVTSVLLTVGFDDKVLTLTNVVDGGILGSAFHSNAKKNPYTLSWANDTATENITANGTAVTLTFAVPENAEIGTTYPITVSYDFDNYDVIDKDMNPINFAVSNGAINVVMPECKHVNVTNVDAKPSTCKEQGNAAYTVCNDCGVVVEGSDEKLPLADHNYESTVKAPTCTEKGVTVFTCSVCQDTYQIEVDALGHTEVEIPAVAPTCTAVGSTAGVKCSVCNVVLRAPEEVAKADHTAGEAVVENKVDATCTQAGKYEEVVYCTVCNAELSRVEKTIEVVAHTEVEIPAVAPTCTTEGSTAGVKCSVCGEVFTAPEVVPAKGHTEETVAGKDATCTETGLTEGKKCSVCGTVIVAQEEIPAKGHDFVNGVCSVCGESNCDHMCHEDGILGFFWKIINFFCKLFGMNQTCDCGALHW